MANVQASGGLHLAQAVGGDGQGDECVMVNATGNSTNGVGIGDPVNLYASAYANIGSGPNVAQVIQGTSSGAVYGVMQTPNPSWQDGTATMNLSQVYVSVSTAAYIQVRIANNQDVYWIPDDGNTAGMTSGHLTYNYPFTVGAPNSTSGMSTFAIASGSGANTATLPLKVIAPYDDPTGTISNNALANALWQVNINNAVRSGGTGTSGV